MKLSTKSILKTPICLFFTLGLLISCSSVEEKSSDKGENVDIDAESNQLQANDPAKLIEQGKFTEAAMMYLDMAGKASSPLKQDIELKAIHLLIQAKQHDTANKLLSELSPNELNTKQTTFFSYLNAKIAVFERNPKKSQQWLAFVKDEDFSFFASHADIIRLYVATYELAADGKNAVLNRISLASHLLDEKDVLQNQEAIIRELLSLDVKTLQNLSQTEKSANVRSWIDLGLVIKASKNPFRLSNQLNIWREQNPTHTIRPSIIASLAPTVDDEPPKLDNIALMLPLTGKFKKPATAIRNGFLASYYAQSNTGVQPSVHIYDTGAENVNIVSLYQQAVENGANIVVGPLRKNAVKAISQNASHPIPTLVLNQLDDSDYYSKNFYQFSLAPEAEAKQTARRAWLDGYNRAAIIFPDNKWGKRVANAFSQEWLNLGGEVAAQADYKAKKNDFSKSIKSLLAIDKSTQRKKSLSKLLRTRLKFEPRRRQDIDFIFMAAFPKQARLIPPQLKFFHAANIPIYATSHSFTGRQNRKKDRDLDSVIIGDMPWTLTRAKNDKYKTQIYRTWPNQSKQFNRLYALGTDAYNILFYLNWLRGNNLSVLQGTTGKLHMSETNRVMRELSWAKFKKGKPTLLPATASLPTQ